MFKYCKQPRNTLLLIQIESNFDYKILFWKSMVWMIHSTVLTTFPRIFAKNVEDWYFEFRLNNFQYFNISRCYGYYILHIICQDLKLNIKIKTHSVKLIFQKLSRIPIFLQMKIFHAWSQYFKIPILHVLKDFRCSKFKLFFTSNVRAKLF